MVGAFMHRFETFKNEKRMFENSWSRFV